MKINIQLIRTEDLYPHPDNPRKDLGDLKELAASIKANGVLQNLTVVPREEGGYTVVIGHRRRAAALEAGIKELPCTVTDMDHKEQLRTMLMENMQRTDLTVYEQAQGFQMMMDLGESIKDLAKDTGFSQSTIRQRIKIAALNKVSVAHAVERGAQISDFLKLDKIEDPLVKDELVEKYIGTPDFNNKLNTALEEQKARKVLLEYEEEIKTWATKIDRHMASKLAYVKAYYPRDKEKPQRPPIGEQAPLYYTMPDSYNTWSSIIIYTEKAAKSEAIEKEAEKKEALRIRMDELDEMAKAFFKRRTKLFADFLTETPEAELEKNKGSIYSFVLPTVIMTYFSGSDAPILAELMGLPEPKSYGDLTSIEGFTDKCASEPLKTLLYVYINSARARQGYVLYEWHNGYPRSVITHMPDKSMDAFYKVLEGCGYQMSTEEAEVQSGMHQIFAVSREIEEKKEEAK